MDDLHALVAGFAENLKTKPEVEGIALLGGLGANGHFDERSDVDFSVFVQLSQTTGIPGWLPRFEFGVFYRTASREVRRVAFNVHQLDITDEGRTDWSEGKKEAFGNARLLFDRAGRIGELIAEKIKWREEQAWESLLEITSKLPPYTEINPRKQASRGLFIDAQQTLNQGIRLIVDAVYLVNRKYAPHDKWRFGRSLSLPWLPAEFAESIQEATLIKEMTVADVDRRVRAISTVVSDILAEIQRIGGDHKLDLYDYACWKILGRQLSQKPFASLLVDALPDALVNLQPKDVEYLVGFVNYFLVKNMDELDSLVSSPSAFAVLGAEQCQRVIKHLKGNGEHGSRSHNIGMA